MKYKSLTVKVTFENGNQMLFGNSYRSLHDQLAEYCRMREQMPVAVAASAFPCVWSTLPKQFQRHWAETLEELMNRRIRKMIQAS